MSETGKLADDALTPLALTYVKLILGFGVWFAVGLAPFLGNEKIRFFSSLLDLYPESMRGVLIPVSGLLMGMIGVTVEFAAAFKGAGEKRLWSWFKRTLGIFLVSFLLLLVAYSFTVIRIDKVVSHDEIHTLSFVTGGLTVPHLPPGSRCGCQEGADADSCLRDAGIDPSHIKTCFGPARIASWTLVLSLLYLLVTGSFVASVGVLVLRKRVKATAARSRSGPTSTPQP
jgi:hypothetical protein